MYQVNVTPFYLSISIYMSIYMSISNDLTANSYSSRVANEKKNSALMVNKIMKMERQV